MVFVAVLNHRIVEVVVCRNLITWGYTVTGNDRTIHNFGRVHKCRNKLFCVNTIIICIVEKSLRLKHVDISNLREIRVHCCLLENRLCLKCLQSIRLYISSGLSEVCRNFQSCHSSGFLIYVCLKSFLRFDYYTEIYGLGKRAIIRCRPAHVNDTFLESDNPSNGNNAASVQRMRSSFSD